MYKKKPDPDYDASTLKIAMCICIAFYPCNFWMDKMQPIA